MGNSKYWPLVCLGLYIAAISWAQLWQPATWMTWF